MADAIPFTAALASNSTSTAFTAKIPKATEPSGTGVFDVTLTPYGMKHKVPSYIHLIPFGKNGNNDTFDMRLWGWSRVGATALWIPYKLLDLSIVLGNIDGAAIAADTFMADTITLNKGIPAGRFSALLNMADDTTGGIVIHTIGARYLEFDFDLAGGQEGTEMNCYFRLFDID